MEKVDAAGISVLVPLHLTESTGPRVKSWNWLKQYWEAIPGLELVIGDDKSAGRDHLSFSKSIAVNDAASRASGDIFAILDADAYLPVHAVIQCANEIRLAKENNWKLWFIPFRQLFRMSEEASNRVLNSNPANPPVISTPPPEADFVNKALFGGPKGMFSETEVWRIGHWYGAMAQIMSREAFETVGGWDGRFCGWGGEDHAAMAAMNTLYGPHKTLPGAIFHLWHPVINPEVIDVHNTGKKRMWEGQTSPNANDALSGRYYWANGNVKRMRQLVDEFKNNKDVKPSKPRAIPPGAMNS